MCFSLGTLAFRLRQWGKPHKKPHHNIKVDLPGLKRSHLFLYSLFFVSVLVFAGSVALPKASANGVYEPHFVFKHNGHVVTFLDVTVSSTFELEVCIDSIPQGYSMVGFLVRIKWTPISQLEVTGVFPNPGGQFQTYLSNALGESQQQHKDISTKSLSLYKVRFHCLTEGTCTITFRAPLPPSIDIQLDAGGATEEYTIDPTPLVCNQHPPGPSTPYHYVGGELFSANKLVVLSPYLALFGVVAVAAVALKRRKD